MTALVIDDGFVRRTAPELEPVVAKLINFSIQKWTVASAWKTAYIHYTSSQSFTCCRLWRSETNIIRHIHSGSYRTHLTGSIFNDQYAYSPILVPPLVH